ncbi:hypothetical protein SASPL_131004 [Salvia splendens]|uniref:RNA helicase n=1 Tax=Salvia splendens TaxID=180675 RepID=A0A8X8ZJY0_SALSN|nr:hypothetical protein SASPL_131004 [Salvia splendens]
MSIQSRSADFLRMEETIRKAMGDLFSRLDESNRRRDQADRTYDQTLKELRDGFVALKVQNSELMVKLMTDNGGNSSAALTGSNTHAQCFSTRHLRWFYCEQLTPVSLLPTHIMPTIKSRRLFTSREWESKEDVVEWEIGKITECGEATEGEVSECGEAAEGKHFECGEATEEGNIGDEAMDDDSPLTSINAISGLTTKVNSVMVDVAEMCDAMCTATSFTTAEYRKTLAIRVLGFDVPRPVKTFEDCGFSVKLMKGRDIIGIAKMGSGKTASFVLPMIIHTTDQPKLAKEEGLIGVICAPTRELAHQMYLEAKKFSKSCGIRVAAVDGGMSKLDQFKELKTMLRATHLVLDEADRMFDLGFEPQIRSIVGQIRPDRPALFFSATRPRKVEKLVREILSDPVRVTVGEKLPVMIDEGGVLVFASKKAAVDEVEAQLLQRGLKVAAFHGDKDQSSRMEILQKSKYGIYHVLVATDVATQGLDIKSITYVVNFDIAKDMDMHVHRIGRIGRAWDKDRTAYTLITQKEARFAGELVNSLIAADQNVSSELMDLAMTDGRSRSKRDARKRGGKRAKGRGGNDPEYVSCLGKRIMCLMIHLMKSRDYVVKLHEETPMLQYSFEVLVADCSQLLHRRPFFKLSEVVLEFGNRGIGRRNEILADLYTDSGR